MKQNQMSEPRPLKAELVPETKLASAKREEKKETYVETFYDFSFKNKNNPRRPGGKIVSFDPCV